LINPPLLIKAAALLLLWVGFVRMRMLIRAAPILYSGNLFLEAAIVAVFYDQLVVVCGAALGPGKLLQALSLARLLLPAFFLPLLLMTLREQAARAGTMLLSGIFIRGLALIGAILLIGQTLLQDYFGLRLELVIQNHLLFYTPLNPGPPNLEKALGMAGLLTGSILLIKARSLSMLAGSVILLASTALPALIEQPLIQDLYWSLFLSSLVLSERAVQNSGMRLHRAELDQRLAAG